MLSQSALPIYISMCRGTVRALCNSYFLLLSIRGGRQRAVGAPGAADRRAGQPAAAGRRRRRARGLVTAAVLFLERDLRPGASASMASALQVRQVLLIGVLASQLQRVAAGGALEA